MYTNTILYMLHGKIRIKKRTLLLLAKFFYMYSYIFLNIRMFTFLQLFLFALNKRNTFYFPFSQYKQANYVTPNITANKK